MNTSDKLSFPLLRMCPTEMHACIHKKTHERIFINSTDSNNHPLLVNERNDGYIEVYSYNVMLYDNEKQTVARAATTTSHQHYIEENQVDTKNHALCFHL